MHDGTTNKMNRNKPESYKKNRISEMMSDMTLTKVTWC